MKVVLRWAGRNGAAIVIAGVVIGLCIPYLAAQARPWLALAIFIFTFGSFDARHAGALAGAARDQP
jgi:hypothetical protein